MEKEINVTVELEQERALNSILKDTVKKDNETIRGMKHIIITLIIGIVFTVCFGFGAFCWYESQFEYTADTTEMTTEGDNASINNVDGNQYNDSAKHEEGVK